MIDDVQREEDDRKNSGVGFLPARDIQTGIDPVTVKIPKVRSKTGNR